MKRNRPSSVDNKAEQIQQALNRIATMSSLVSRTQLMSQLGLSYDGDRELYTSLGYKQTLVYDDYVNIASREGLGKRVNEAPCDAIWRMPPRVYDVGEVDSQSTFEKAWDELDQRLQLWNKFNRADKLLGFGPYAIILLGFDDVHSEQDTSKPVSGVRKLLYVQTYASEYVTIKSYVMDPKDPRYGQPEIYEVRQSELVAEDGVSRSINLRVHWTRVLHIMEGNLQNEVMGEPRLQRSFNRLQDIQKILGASGEIYWRDAKPGYLAKLGADVQWDKGDPNVQAMQDQLKEFEHNLRRVLMLQGVDVTSLNNSIGQADPMNFLAAQLEDLSAGSRIPKRFLTGSERGELASSQDRDNWIDYIDERRGWFASPVVVKPFIDRMIMFGVLPKPLDDDYRVVWPDLRTPSDKDKADVGVARSQALSNYLNAPGADALLPPEMFMRYGLGLDEEALKEVTEWYAEQQQAEEAQASEDLADQQTGGQALTEGQDASEDVSGPSEPTDKAVAGDEKPPKTGEKVK
jgi:hypothetical protein